MRYELIGNTLVFVDANEGKHVVAIFKNPYTHIAKNVCGNLNKKILNTHTKVPCNAEAFKVRLINIQEIPTIGGFVLKFEKGNTFIVKKGTPTWEEVTKIVNTQRIDRLYLYVSKYKELCYENFEKDDLIIKSVLNPHYHERQT